MKHFNSFDGSSIAYLDEGVGRTVILLHGFASEHRGNWVAPGVVKALVTSGHRVVAPDARGHGNSAKPHDPLAYGHDAMVRDVQALLDHLELPAVDVVGYSMGSLVATRLVPKEKRARSLVLGGVGGNLTGEDRPRNHAALADALEADDPSTITDPVSRAFRAFADLTGADRLALAAIQRSPGTTTAQLSDISIPTLVLTGDADTLVGRPDELAKRISGATFKILRGDHLTAVSDPEFANSIVEFVDSVSVA